MKKIVVLFFVCLISVVSYAQTLRFSGNIGTNFAIDGYSNMYLVNYGAFGGIGITDNINYIGVSVELGGFTDHYAEDEYYAANFTGFNMPIYAEYNYSNPATAYNIHLM